eukprot:Opistho-2@70889
MAGDGNGLPDTQTPPASRYSPDARVAGHGNSGADTLSGENYDASTRISVPGVIAITEDAVREKDVHFNGFGDINGNTITFVADLEGAVVKDASDGKKDGARNGSTTEGGADEADFKAPHLSLWALFVVFLGFGFRAWGGPTAQIALLKEKLVIQEKWVSIRRFNRVFALYQALPGPEAAELCCFFGYCSRGRIGSLVAGLGFVLPGFGLMLLLTYLYDEFGLENQYVRASFRAVQAGTTALVFRAVHRIGEHSFADHETKGFSWPLFLIAMVSALQQVMRINFFITLTWCGLVVLGWRLMATRRLPRWLRFLVLGLWLSVSLAGYLVFAVLDGVPDKGTSITAGSGSNSLGNIFLNGLLAGLLTFGGAYTAIPFVRNLAVIRGHWMTTNVFLDGLAIANVIPSPLVIFVTFVGYYGGSWGGAVLMTVGMFLPAFSFTLIGHSVMERALSYKYCGDFLDGITASVVGLIAITAWELLRATVTDPHLVCIFFFILAAMYKFQHPFLSSLLIIGAAIVGQVLFTTD